MGMADQLAEASDRLQRLLTEAFGTRHPAIDDLAVILFAVKDARRYRWLRKQHWNDAPLCVVVQPRQAVKLGYDCPALDRLDAAIDEAMASSGAKEDGNG